MNDFIHLSRLMILLFIYKNSKQNQMNEMKRWNNEHKNGQSQTNLQTKLLKTYLDMWQVFCQGLNIKSMSSLADRTAFWQWCSVSIQLAFDSARVSPCDIHTNLSCEQSPQRGSSEIDDSLRGIKRKLADIIITKTQTYATYNRRIGTLWYF